MKLLPIKPQPPVTRRFIRKLENREEREEARRLVFGQDDAFPFELGMRAEINQQAELEAGDFEVI